MYIMGTHLDGGPGMVILRHPFPRLVRVHPGRTSLLYHFLNGGGFHDRVLGDASCREGGSPIMFWMGLPVDLRVFLCG